MSNEQRDTTIGTLLLRVIPTYGEQVVLLDADGAEVGTEVVSTWGLDGYATAVRDAAANVIRDSLPDIDQPKPVMVEPYRRALLAPAELERGMLVEIGDTGAVLGEVADRDVIGSLDTLATGTWADGRTFAFPFDKGLWVRIPN